MRLVLIILISCFSVPAVLSQSLYFNNTYNNKDSYGGFAVIEQNSNYIVYGSTYDSLNNAFSVYIASIDSAGEINYWKTISDSNSIYWATTKTGGLVNIRDNGFVASGCILHPDRTNAILYRFDNFGDTLWTKQYPDTLTNNRTQFWDCNTTYDGGFIMTGTHFVEYYHDNCLLVKCDSLGNEQWRREYGVYNTISNGYSVVQTPDRGYLLGYYNDIITSQYYGDPMVMKVDSLGYVEWTKNLGGNKRDYFSQVCLGNDGSYIAGTSISDSISGNNSYSRIKIHKLSQNGDIIWQKYYCGTELNNQLHSIYPDHNGGYIAIGYRNNINHPGHWSKIYGWLLKIDEDGDSLWYREYQYHTGSEHDKNCLFDLCLAPDGGYTMVGQAQTLGTPWEAWVIKIDSLGCDTPGCAIGVGIKNPLPLVPRTSYLQIFPNPATQYIDCRWAMSDGRSNVFIYDLFGRKQDELIIPKGQTQARIDVSAYPSGIYIAVLKNESGIVARSKFIKR